MAVITKGTTKLLGFAGLFLLTVGAGAGLGYPTFVQFQQQQEELKTAETTVTTLATNRDSLLVTRENHENVKKFNDEMLEAFPELAQTPELLTAIQISATRAGINPNQVASVTFEPPVIQSPTVTLDNNPEPPPAPEAETNETATEEETTPEGEAGTPEPTEVDTSADRNSFAAIGLSITIAGTPAQLEDFLSNLNGMDRALIITTFSTSDQNEEGNNDKVLSLSGTTYLYSKIAPPEEILNGADAVTEPPAEDGS